MSDKALLEKLWQSYGDKPFSKFSLHRKSDLCHDESDTALRLLQEMSESGETQNGYRIKRVASTMYKFISQAQGDSDSLKDLPQTQGDSDSPKDLPQAQGGCDSLKGLPLTDPQESLVGANTASFHDQSPENADFSINDPFPRAPAELKERRQWVCWRAETRDSKPTKVPYQTIKRNGEYLKAQSNQADTWTDYQTVCDHLDNFSGIGFVFSGDDPYCGIDLDDCLDAQGDLKDWAKPIVDRLKGVGYGERSPSGNGIKFWTRATLPTEAKHKAYIVKGADAIEAYDRLRYFTVTGRGKGDIGDGQAVIDWLCAEHLSEPQRPTHTTEQTPQLPRSVPTAHRPVASRSFSQDNSSSGNLNAEQVIERIRASPQSAKFNALMAGNTTGHGSQSEADLRLCGVIACWSQENAVIDAIFRTSGLMRDKWDERHKSDGSTYGAMTIKEALSGSRETYTQTRQARATNQRHLRRERYGYDRF